jgi:hypothetical protein
MGKVNIPLVESGLNCYLGGNKGSMPAFFLKNALVVADQGVDDQDESHYEAADENAVRQSHEARLSIAVKGRKDPEEDKAAAQNDGAASDGAPKGEAIRLRYTVAVIGMERGKIAAHMRCAEDDAKDADQNGNDGIYHKAFSLNGFGGMVFRFGAGRLPFPL